METKTIILALALGASTCLLTAQDSLQRPDGQRPPGREGGPGGVSLLPPPVRRQLNLSARQQKEVVDVEAETMAKIGKILTPEQRQQLKQMRPPQREGGPGGPGDPGGGPDGPGGLGGQPPVIPIIEALDLNKDGIIDANEIAKASASLRKLDKNGDGKITPDEYRPPGREGGPGGPGGPGEAGRPQRPAMEK